MTLHPGPVVCKTEKCCVLSSTVASAWSSVFYGSGHVLRAALSFCGSFRVSGVRVKKCYLVASHVGECKDCIVETGETVLK